MTEISATEGLAMLLWNYSMANSELEEEGFRDLPQEEQLFWKSLAGTALLYAEQVTKKEKNNGH
jgi:hypothetical protein